MAMQYYLDQVNAPRQTGFHTLPHGIYRCYNSFIANNNLTNNRTSRLFFGIYMNLVNNGFPGVVCLPSDEEEGIPAVGADDPFCIFLGAEQVTPIDEDIPGGLDHEGTTSENGQEIYEVSIRCPGWIVELGVCHHVKRMNINNVTSFFRSVNHDTTIQNSFLQLLDFLVSRLPDLFRHDQAITQTRRTQWGVYHTSYSSIGTLYLSFKTSYPTVYQGILSEVVCQSLENYARNSHLGNLHRALTTETLAKIGIGLRAANGLPNQVYSIERAIGLIAPTIRTAWQVAFVRLLDLHGNLDQIRAGANDNEVLDRAGLRAPVPLANPDEGGDDDDDEDA